MTIEEDVPTNGAPNIDPKANPNKWEIAPSGRRVIEVKNATYRTAVFSGFFLVANSAEPYGPPNDGHKTIEVECYWYGWKPKTRWIRITLINEEVDLVDYSNQEVIKNIGA
jgi:hypothetical protein